MIRHNETKHRRIWKRVDHGGVSPIDFRVTGIFTQHDCVCRAVGQVAQVVFAFPTSVPRVAILTALKLVITLLIDRTSVLAQQEITRGITGIKCRSRFMPKRTCRVVRRVEEIVTRANIEGNFPYVAQNVLLYPAGTLTG